MPRDELNEDLRAFIDREIERKTRYHRPYRAYVTYVYEHVGNDEWNHEVDVRLIAPQLDNPWEYEVPVVTSSPVDVGLPSDEGRNYSLSARPGDETVADNANNTDGKQPTEKSAVEKPTDQKPADLDDRPECIVEYENGDPDSPMVTGWLYSEENRAPTSRVNDRRWVIDNAEIEIRTTEDGDQYIQAGFEESGNSTTDESNTSESTTEGEPTADGSGRANYGFFPGQGHFDAFQSWAKPATTVVDYASVFDGNPAAYIQDEVASLASKGGTPILTLEPSGKGGSVAADTAAGEYDARWSSWGDAISNYDGQLIVRLAHEMNGDWYEWAGSPSAYVNMWQHVHGLLDGENVQWCWCPNAEDVPSTNDAENYYPGDQYVDIIGIDGYNHGSSSSSGWRTPTEIFDGMVGRLSSLASKPIIIPETASSSMQSGVHNTSAKNQWISDLFSYADSAGIQTVNWFNQDKEEDWAVFGGERGTGKTDVNGQSYNVYSNFATESATRSNPGEPISGSSSGTGSALEAVGGPANATVAPGVYADKETVAVLDKNGNDRLAALESGVTSLQSGGATGTAGDGSGVLPNTDPTAPPEERAEQAGITINNTKTVTSMAQIDGASNTLYIVDGSAGPLQHDGKHGLGTVNNVAICGINDARLEVPAGFRDYSLTTSGGSNFMWSGIDLDQTASGAYGRLNISVAHAGFVESFQTIGSGAPSGGGPGEPYAQLHTPATSSSGTVRIKDVSLIHGGHFANNHQGKIGAFGIQFPGNHQGTLNIVDSQIEEFPNNGIYASACAGTINVKGGRYFNNGVSQVRIADGTIDGATIGYDYQNTGMSNADASGHGIVGIGSEQKKNGRGGSVDVKNCTFEWTNVKKTRAAIATYDIHSAGKFGVIEGNNITVDNAGGAAHIRIDGNGNAIRNNTFGGSVSGGSCLVLKGQVSVSGNTNNTNRPMGG